MIYLFIIIKILQINKMSIPTFDFIPQYDRIIYSTAYDAIIQLELSEYVIKEQKNGFIFSQSSSEVSAIYDKIIELGYNGHSGASFGFILRTMQYIMKNGYDNFKNDYLNKNK